MEAAEDWAFKLNNLTYLFEGLENFYANVTRSLMMEVLIVIDPR